jgi:hypothetical protein
MLRSTDTIYSITLARFYFEHPSVILMLLGNLILITQDFPSVRLAIQSATYLGLYNR